MSFWLLSTALAWQPGPAEAVRLPGHTVALGVIGGSTPPLVLVLDESRLLALQDGNIVARRDVKALDLLVADLDRDGRDEVLLCGENGLAAVPVAGRSLGEALLLDPTPCTRMSVGNPGEGQVFFTGAKGTHEVKVVDSALLVRNLELEVTDKPLLAATTDTVALGSAGGTTLLLLQPAGGAMLPLGGPLVALTAVGDTLAWVHGGEPTVLHLGGSRIETERPITYLAAFHTSDGPQVAAWSGEGWVLPKWDLPVGRPVLADIDGDACPDILIGTDEGYVQALGNCAEPSLPVPPSAPPASTGADAVPAAKPSTPQSEEDQPDEERDPQDADAWPPLAWTDGRRVPAAELPHPPDRLELGGDRHTVAAFVGQEVRIHLSPPTGRVQRIEGGPPGSRLEAGAFVVEPEAWDIGRWAVATRGGPGEWYGFDIEVWPRPQVGDPVPVPASAPVGTTPSGASVDSADHWFHIDHCTLGVGLAAGASRGGGLAWEDLGSPSVQASGSPAVAAMCDGGGTLRWVVGVDAAPWFRYTDLPTDRSHLISATAGLQVGNDRFGVGPYGSAGVTAVNLGVRGQGFVSQRVGVELRAGWLAPRAGVEAMALLLYRIPRR